MPTPPSTVSIAGFKLQFTRDFNYGTTLDTVTDGDLTRSLYESSMNFNQTLWDSQETPITYYYLMAHVLVLNIQAAGGLASKKMLGQGVLSKGSANIIGKSVGAVSVQYDTQDESFADPILAQFMRTEYGRKYLQMVRPRLVGNTNCIAGDTEPDIANPGQGPVILL